MVSTEQIFSFSLENYCVLKNGVASMDSGFFIVMEDLTGPCRKFLSSPAGFQQCLP
jgi:hypothetical protein